MLRKLFAISSLALALTGCGSTGLFSGSNPVITPQQITDAQGAVKQLCGVIPTAVTVVSVLTANPAIIAGGAGLNAFATDVCNAIAAFKTTPGASPMVSLPTVYGVPIKVY